MARKKMTALNDCRGMSADEIIDVILRDRDIGDLDRFLHPVEDDLLSMDNMGNIELAKEKIENASTIMVLADVDLDGVSSNGIIVRGLRYLFPNKTIECNINNGKDHGLKKRDVSVFLDYDLLIIVDSLDSDCEQYQYLYEHGVEIIVLDHHAIDKDVNYEEYVTLISSQYDLYDNKDLSGAGVCWKFINWLYEQYGIDELSEFSAYDLIDLCACGMSADMMDMKIQENRFLLSKGIENLRNLAVTKMKGSYPFDTNSINFSVAPLVNSAVRMNKNDDAMNVFLSDDNKEVLKHMRVLKKCKDEQNTLVDNLMEDAIEQANEQINNPFIFIVIDTEYGVSGLLANKLLDLYQRPIIVVKDCGYSYAGSMRAIGVDDFRKIINDSGVATASGHELASGVFIDKKYKDDLFDYLFDALFELDIDSVELESIADVQIDVEDITMELINKAKELDKISGKGFPPIKFLIDNINTYEVSDYSKRKHLVIKPDDKLQVIKWNWHGDWDSIEDSAIIGDTIQCIGTLNSGFIGRTFCNQLICDEIEVKNE